MLGYKYQYKTVVTFPSRVVLCTTLSTAKFAVSPRVIIQKTFISRLTPIVISCCVFPPLLPLPRCGKNTFRPIQYYVPSTHDRTGWTYVPSIDCRAIIIKSWPYPHGGLTSCCVSDVRNCFPPGLLGFQHARPCPAQRLDHRFGRRHQTDRSHSDLRRS